MNGITGPVDVADAWDMAGMLVSLKRAVHPNLWVSDLIARRQSEELLNLW